MLDALRENFERQIADLRQGIELMETGKFRLWRRNLDDPAEVDITADTIIRDREIIALLTRLISDDANG